jgi:hypothetical protein
MHADHLTLANLRGVMNRTWAVRSKWKEIGIELKLEITDLEAISKKNGSDTDACFTEMLSIWLKQTKSPPTWLKMIGALKYQPVGFQHLAEHIKMNSLTRKRSKSLQLPLKGTIEPDEEGRDGPEFEGRLRAQTKHIKMKFNALECKLFDTLKDYSFKKLAEYLKKYSTEVNIKSFKDVRDFIENKSSFYDYEIMEYIIHVAGTKDDKERLQQYENDFKDYAWERFQSPSTSPTTPDSQLSKICIKLDSEYGKLQHDPDKLMQLHCRLCNLLKIPMGISWST